MTICVLSFTPLFRMRSGRCWFHILLLLGSIPYCPATSLIHKVHNLLPLQHLHFIRSKPYYPRNISISQGSYLVSPCSISISQGPCPMISPFHIVHIMLPPQHLHFIGSIPSQYFHFAWSILYCLYDISYPSQGRYPAALMSFLPFSGYFTLLPSWHPYHSL